MTVEQIKEHLDKHSLKTKNLLANHIIQLKRNTKPNTELISELVHVLEDEFFSNFFAKKDKILGGYNKPTVKSSSTRYEFPKEETRTSYNTIFDLNKVKGCSKGGLQCFCDGSCHEKKPLDFEIDLKELSKIKPADLSKMLSRSINALTGVKESQEVKKAPIFTYCRVNRNAIEALSLRALYGHEKYEKGDDWENFSRVPNGDFEYGNAEFRHALGIGEEDEETHLIAGAWNAVARLEIYLRNKVK